MADPVLMIIIHRIEMMISDNGGMRVISKAMDGVRMGKRMTPVNNPDTRTPGTVAVVGFKRGQGNPADISPGMNPVHPARIPGKA